LMMTISALSFLLFEQAVITVIIDNKIIRFFILRS